MKFTITIFFFFLIGQTNNSSIVMEEKTELAPCPSSPNCVSTQEKRRRKRMQPIPFFQEPIAAKVRLKNLMTTYSRVTLIEEKEYYLHYEFKTKLGKFIDDVEFLFDKKTKQIHFRSASRKGWGDFGKNKRRMKKIRKDFKNNTFTVNPKF